MNKMNPNEQEMKEEVPALILNIWNAVDQIKEEQRMAEATSVLNKISMTPDPFITSIKIELGIDTNEHVVVRMTNSKGTILRLFGWHLISGTNVTSIAGLSSLPTGEYIVEVLNHLGVVIFKKSIKKG